MPYTGKVSNAGISVDTNNDGIPDGRAMTVKNGGNFTTFSLTNGVLTIQPATAGASAGGSDTQVQFNDGGSAFGGHSGLVYDKTFNTNAGKLTVANLVISGDLTVSGTTTTVNTNTVTIADNIIVLNSDATGSASANAGIEIERGDDANVQLLWDETNDQWDFDTYALGSVGKVFAAGSGAVYTFTSDTDTGVEHAGTNQLGLLAGNTRVLMVNANGVHIDPTGASGAGSNQALLVDNISIDTNTIASTNTNGNIVLAPNGTGDVQLDADTVRVGDSGADATITTNGAGDLVLNTNAGTNSGSITVEDGANNDILLIPNGTGKVGVGQTTPTAKLHVNGDATISGNLTVSGTTTSVSTTNTNVADALITLNQGETGNGITGNIAGFEVDRGEDTGNDNPIARFVFDDADDKFKAQIESGSDTGTYNTADLVAKDITASSFVKSGGASSEFLKADGSVDTNTYSTVTYTDADAISAVQGEATLDLTGDVTIATGKDLTVDTNTLHVDGGNNRVGIGTTSPSYQLHNISTGTGYTTAIQTDEDSAGFGPGVLLHRKSTSAADNDNLAKITFGGRNDADEDILYGDIYAIARDVSDSTEDGALVTTTIVAGTQRQRITIEPSEVVINEDSIDSDFRVETDGDQETFFVQGSSDRIGISTTSPIATLDIDAGGTFRTTRLLTTTITSSDTLVEADHAGRYVFVTGSSVIVSLPVAATAGLHFTLLSNDANGFTLRTGAGAGTGNTMNGSQADISVSARDGVTCIGDGSNWVVLGV